MSKNGTRMDLHRFEQTLEKAGIHLNPQQREAVITENATAVVFAGPGSGKTTVLLSRIAYLLMVKKVHPGRLLVVTFTRAAAQEMKDRLRRLTGPERIRQIEMGTFHSVFLRILNRFLGTTPRILSAWEQQNLVREALRSESRLAGIRDTDSVMGRISVCKNHLQGPGPFDSGDPENDAFHRVFERYEQVKRDRGVWDFDDILVRMHAALLENSRLLQQCRQRFPYILVDEFQDTNLAQAEILGMLGQGGAVYVVGDDDQSIYRFRGARVEYLLEFGNRFPDGRKFYLTVNHRSCEPVIEAANRLIAVNRTREGKSIAGTGRQGPEPRVIRSDNELQEAERVADSVMAHLREGRTTAVLFRVNAQSRALVDALVQRGIPFAVKEKGFNFYAHWAVRDILAYFRFACEQDIASFAKIANRPFRGIPNEAIRHLLAGEIRSGDVLLDVVPAISTTAHSVWKQQLVTLRSMAPARAVSYVRYTVGYEDFLDVIHRNFPADREAVHASLLVMETAASAFDTLPAFLDHVDRVGQATDRSRHSGAALRLLTCHRSKGLEFDHVILLGCAEGLVPHVKSLDSEGLEEERRLFYVGITRARESVTFSVPQTYRGADAAPSRFLHDMRLPGLDPGNERTSLKRIRRWLAVLRQGI
jgi:DNA helicase-2/ATP-dependent DNA helicase PcrA